MKKDKKLIKRIDQSLTAYDAKEHQAEECVVYTDGGARPNPGYSGFGIYAKDSNGCIYNAWGGLSSNSTNSRAELAAYIYALKAALYFNWRNVTLFIDSKYVLEGAKTNLQAWKKRGWKKVDGNIIVNLDLWECIDGLHEKINKAGIKLRYRWVKGHSGVYGNEMADKNAEKGRLCIVEGKVCSTLHIEQHVEKTVKTVAPKKTVVEKIKPINRLIAGKRLLFVTNTVNTLPDDYHVYMSTSFEDKSNFKGKLLGRPASDNMYNVCLLEEPIEPLETVIEYQNIITPDDYAQPVIGMMDRISKPANWELISKEGYKPLSHKRFSIISPDGEPLTQYVRPAKRGYIALNILSVMLERLNQYRCNSPAPNTEYVDITENLYRKSGKKHILQPDINGKQAKSYTLKIPHGKKTSKITLTLGIDVPVRNNMAAIGRDYKDIKILLVKYDITKTAYRYCVIFHVNDDYAIYSTSDANLNIIRKN